MFKKRKNPKAKFRSKKRSAGDSSIASGASSKKFRSNDENDSDNDGAADEGATLLEQYKAERKQLKNTGTSKKKDVMHQFKTSEEGPSAAELATRGAEHHPEEKDVSIANEGDESGEGADEGGQKLYKGTKEVRNKFLAGPLKAPTFVRTTTRFDYQPDICKDYKETGFCGFGDTCIYLHDRGNTLSGWQLEEEYERKRKEAQDAKEQEMDNFCRQVRNGPSGEVSSGNTSSSASATATDDGLPFACHLCRNPFTDPIVTKCNHYFCQKCIMGYLKEEDTMSCPICSKDTYGVFNHPTKLVSKKRRLVGSSATWAEFAGKSQG